MRNKRGMENEMVKIILAVIAIILILIPLAVKLYNSFYAGHTQTEQAKAILKEISSRINAMTTERSVDSMIFAGPEGWILFAEGEGTNVCVCDGGTSNVCTSTSPTKSCIPLVNKKASIVGNQISIYLTEAQLKLTSQNGEQIVEITQKPSTK